MHRTVTFKSEYANDWQFDEHDNPVAPGAREVAERIAAQLSDHVSATTAIDHHSDYGWSFETRFENCRFDHVLNPVDDDCYLTITCRAYSIRKLLFKKPRETFLRYCTTVDEALQQIPRLSGFQWDHFGN